MLAKTNNPIYAIKFAANEPAIVSFSKTIENTFNPKSEFIALMTCDSANEACPHISGADIRIPLMYEDPKKFDDSPNALEKYEERSQQIATEMKYVFSRIAH